MTPRNMHMTSFENKVLGDSEISRLEWILTPNDYTLLRKGPAQREYCTVYREGQVQAKECSLLVLSQVPL